MPPHGGQREPQEPDDYAERYRARIPSRVTSRAAIESMASLSSTGPGRSSGRLEALKGELHCIRDRFRDVKIEDMKEAVERERVEKEEEARSRARMQRPPLETYFDQFKKPTPATSSPQPSNARKASSNSKAGNSKLRSLEPPPDPKVVAREYFERTRRVPCEMWEEEEAKAYFAEKRKMADAAWRMQQVLDSTPHANWQKEMQEFQKAKLEVDKKKKKPPPVTGYLLPWGAPKPVAKRPTSPSRLPTAADAAGHLAEPLPPGYAESSKHTFMGAHDMDPMSLSLPGKESSLPVSFGPGAFQEASFSGNTWTTSSFEPLSPKWDGDPSSGNFLATSSLKATSSGGRGSTRPNTSALAAAPPIPTTEMGYSGYTVTHEAPRKAVEVQPPLAFPSSKLFTASAEPYVLTPLAVGPAPAAPPQPVAKISYLNAVEDSPPSVLQMRFSSSGFAHGEAEGEVMGSGEFPSRDVAFDEDDDDDALLVRRERVELVAPPVESRHRAAAAQPRFLGSAAGGKAQSINRKPSAAPSSRTSMADPGFMPSPPMALSILGPGSGVQELML